MIFRLTETERAVRDGLYVRRWQTTGLTERLHIDQFAVAQALYYLHKYGKTERQPSGEGFSKWRLA